MYITIDINSQNRIQLMSEKYQNKIYSILNIIKKTVSLISVFYSPIIQYKIVPK